MAATASAFAEDGTTELTFADGVVTRIPSAIVYDWLGNHLAVANIVKNVAAQAVAAGTPVTIWTPASGKAIRVLGFMLSLSVAGSVMLKYGAGGTEFLRTPLMAAGAGLASPPLGNGILPGNPNDVLKIDVTATGAVSGFVFGSEE